MASTQKTAQKQSRLTSTQSTALVKNVFRAAFSSIAYIRNLFEPENFTKAKIGKAKYFKIHEEAAGDALTFKRWLEEGVFHALSLKYLQVVRIELYRAQPEAAEKKRKTRKQKAGTDDERTSKNLLESYAFRVTYEEGGPTVEFCAADGRNSREVGKEEVKKEVGEIMGSLIDLTNTMQPLPPNRLLSIKLMFTENTPMDYQPPLFSKCGEDAWFEDIPIQATVGKIYTPFHKLEVEVFARNTAKNRQKKVLHGRGLKAEEVKAESEIVDGSRAERAGKGGGQMRSKESAGVGATDDDGERAEDIRENKRCTNVDDTDDVEEVALKVQVSQGDGGREQRRLGGEGGIGKERRVMMTQDSDFEEVAGRKRGGPKRMSQVEEAVVQRHGGEKRMRRGK